MDRSRLRGRAGADLGHATPVLRSGEMAQVSLAYWKTLRRWTLLLLVAWLLVSLCVPWFAVELNRFEVARFPLGYWMSSQGAVAVYLLLIGIYVFVTEKLDSALLAVTQSGEDGSAGS